jgi:hypothetical protein
MVKICQNGWWYTYPSEKYEFVNASIGIMKFPTEWKVIKPRSSHHQPGDIMGDINEIFTGSFYHPIR